MITNDDLRWWLDLEPELDWQFATTYAATAPHEYVVAGRTQGIDADDLMRAAHVIRTFGEPMKFFDSTRIYLVTPRGWKHWDMRGPRLGDEPPTLINRGRVEHVYGVQNAPHTASDAASAYDGLATTWHRDHAMSDDERDGVTGAIREAFGDRLWRTLDIGCGTGWSLDAGLVEPGRYVGVDPSTGMLNALVLAHPHVAGVHPMSFAEAERRRVLGGTRFDSVLALGGSASYLSADEVDAALARAKRGAVLVAYAEGVAPDPSDLTERQLAEARSRLRALANAPGGSVREVGRFEVATVRAAVD